MDATRISDGEIVMMKRIVDTKQYDELAIAKFFSSKPLASNPKNHCIPLLDALEVPDYKGVVLLVMPILHPFKHPKICMYGEAVKFFWQAFEVRSGISSYIPAASRSNVMFQGIQFMHKHHYAHQLIFSTVSMIRGLTKRQGPWYFKFEAHEPRVNCLEDN